MENFQDIFNLNPDDFIENDDRKESEIYKPDPKKGKDNTYKSLIRFVPWHKDPKNSKIKKFTYWLNDPLTGDSFSVDCPSSINQKSPIQDIFWKLKKSQSVAEQKLSDKFKRREKYYALVQILKDDNDPSMVGKIKILAFGQKLNNILQSELQPEYGKAYNPFDPFKGRVMSLNVSIVAGYNNYDLSKFVGDENPPMLDGKPISQTPEDMKRFVEYLKENSPNLDNFSYREWDDEMREKVRSVIENTVPTMRTAENMQKSVSAPAPQNISVAETARMETAAIEEDKQVDLNDLDLDLDSSDDDDFSGSLYDGL